MKSIRTLMMVSSIAAVVALVFLGAQLQIPTAFAFPILHFSRVHAVPSFTGGNPVALGSNTCVGSGCHTSTGSPGSAAVSGFPAGMTYTPGTVLALTVTVNDTAGPRIGYELTARLASNTANAAGTLAAGTNSNSGTDVVPVVQGLINAPTNTFNLTWTPPAKGSGSVNFYLTGWSGSFPSGHAYTAMYTLTEAASGTAPSITSANSTTFTVGKAGAFTVTATGTPKPTLSESGALAGGVTFNASTGVLSGTPTASGIFPITFTAQNGTIPNATQNFTLTVNAVAPPPPPPPPAPGSGSMSAQPEIHDPSSSGGVSAQYVNHLGDPTPVNAGLVLLKNASAPSGTWTGASILNVSGSLSELGYDYIVGGQCTYTSPRFIVVTTDAVTHVVGGCRTGTITRNTPAVGWTRVRFDSTALDHATPPITPGMQLRSVTLVLDQGPSTSGSAGGLVVIDNIDVSGKLITGGTSANPNPNPNPNPAPNPPPTPNPPPPPPGDE